MCSGSCGSTNVTAHSRRTERETLAGSARVCSKPVSQNSADELGLISERNRSAEFSHTTGALSAVRFLEAPWPAARRGAAVEPHTPPSRVLRATAIRRWRTAWRAACQAAGVPTRFLHDCRRTAARRPQTSGATPRGLNPGFSERIGNSRRTGPGRLTRGECQDAGVAKRGHT